MLRSKSNLLALAIRLLLKVRVAMVFGNESDGHVGKSVFFFFLVDPFCSIFMRCLYDIYMYTFIYLVGSLAVAFALALTTWYSIIVKFYSIFDIQIHGVQVILNPPCAYSLHIYV